MNSYLKQLMQIDREWTTLIKLKKKRIANPSLSDEQRERCRQDLQGLLREKEDITIELEQIAEPHISQPLTRLLSCQRSK